MCCLCQLIPSLCKATYSGDVELKVYILDQLVHIVGVARHHMQMFLDPIMQMLKDLWHDGCEERTLMSILQLIGELAGTIFAIDYNASQPNL